MAIRKLLRIFGITAACFVITGLVLSQTGITDNSTSETRGHGAEKQQCQSPCVTASPTEELAKLLKEREADKDPIPVPYYAEFLGLVLGAVLTIKRGASFSSNWRPPDLVKLHSQYLL